MSVDLRALSDFLDLAGPGVVRARVQVPVVEISGADARRFANGMFTNNVRDLAVGRVQRTAMVDDRGRVLGLLDLACLADDRFVAALEGVDPGAFVERYDGFVFAEDVTFTARPDLSALTVQGSGAASALVAAGLPAPDPGGVAPAGSGFVLWHDRAGTGGYDVLFAEAGPSLVAPELTPDDLEALRVRAGIARWPVDFTEKSLPHEMGMRDRYLHFEKGCYVGQESIHRIDVLGQVRRHLMQVWFDVAAGALPPAGAEVHQDGKVVGSLTSPVQVPEGGVALAVLREPAATPGATVTIHSGGAQVPAVVSALPRAG